MLEFIKVRGSQESKPQEIDTTSSQYYIYVRKNIKEVHEEGDDYNPPFDGWEYEEAKILNDEWAVDQIEKLKEANDALMLGLVDLYEMQLGE